MGLSDDQFFWLVLGAIAGITIILGAFAEYMTARTKTRCRLEQTRAREETRRELAAYVAEGSMTPEDAERILCAEPSQPAPSRRAENREQQAEALAGGPAH